MIAVAESFERIDEADFLEERAGGLRGALVRAIAEAELDGIDARHRGDLVHEGLHREGIGDLPGRADRRNSPADWPNISGQGSGAAD